jgi:predicted HTH domain antitoxin
MKTITAEIPVELDLAAGLDADNVSLETARLLALELYRADKVSLGRAAELCQTAIERFMEFAGQHGVALHYGTDELAEDRTTLDRLGL